MKKLVDLALLTLLALALASGAYNVTHAPDSAIAFGFDGPPCPINLCPPASR
jgi:hypothetical protein